MMIWDNIRNYLNHCLLVGEDDSFEIILLLPDLKLLKNESLNDFFTAGFGFSIYPLIYEKNQVLGSEEFPKFKFFVEPLIIKGPDQINCSNFKFSTKTEIVCSFCQEMEPLLENGNSVKEV
ncbi:hypothetical protein BpHYR1_050227 [Brachionus plicatilis]|uniref:Uncharacterized protein n=1 Tax=Brachionus plicatilis TaxID=10195 RepID=A0A3M7RJG3_BRAPC|nr:hypothetical protein BpHYR1_050227 [Brachionus plicatilis]